MNAGAGWPLWRRDDPAGLLSYIAEDSIAELLPGLPSRAAGRAGDQLARLRTVYSQFAAAGIAYADEPIASTGAAQQVRTPGEILALPRHANCLDLSLTFAAACLHAGLHPLIAVYRPPGTSGAAHALVLVWLGGDWPGRGGDHRYLAPGPDDHPLALTEAPRWPGGLRPAAGNDLPGEFAAVDVALAAAAPGRGPASFDEAVASAAQIVIDLNPSGPGDRGEPVPSSGSASQPPILARWQWEFGVDVGLHYLPETVALQPGRPLVSPLTKPYLQVQGSGPLAQFRARTEVVPFADRGELSQLLDWCMTPDIPLATPDTGSGGSRDGDGEAPLIKIAVVSGTGGAGKTRLAAEAAKRLAARNWYTGFLPRVMPNSDDVEWLATVVSPVLIVVDYVEAADFPALTGVVRTLSARRSRTVLVFTARSRGDWWLRLTRDLADAGLALPFSLDLDLAPRPPQSARLFSKAYRRFTAQAGTATRDEPAPPGGQAHWTALDLVMLAWIAANTGPDLPGTPDQLYDDVISRELAAWADAMKTGNRPEPTIAALRATAACVSLLNPTAPRLTALLSRAGITELTSAAPGEITEKLAGFLRQPGEAELSLRPDPIADYLILTSFHSGPSSLFGPCVDFIDLPDPTTPTGGTPPAAAVPRPEPERFCDNLTRAGENSTISSALPLARDLATTALTRKPGLWNSAFETALNRGGAFTPALEKLADRTDMPLPFAEIDARIPYGHSSLRALALTAAQRTLPASPGVQADPAQAARTAAALDNLATRLAEAGRRDEALAPAREAASLYRQLAEVAPAAYLPDFAGALNNLGIQLADAGRRDEALAAAREAVAIRRQLAEAAPAAHLPDLAAALNNLGNRLAWAGRRDEALAAAREAVAIRRQLAEAAPAAYLPDLASVLNNLGNRLAEAGRRDEALAPVQEAASLYRQLAEAAPAAYLPDFATALLNLGVRLAEAGRPDEALAPVQEAVAISRQLAEVAPAAYLPDLAGALNNLGVQLAGAGHPDEALAPAREAASLYRQLAEAAPAAHLPHLASALNNLGNRLAEAGRRDEALASAREAASLYRQLAEAAPAAHLPHLASALSNLGSRWRGPGAATRH